MAWAARLFALGMTFIIIAGLLILLSSTTFPQTTTKTFERDRKNVWVRDDFSVRPGFQVVYFNAFTKGTKLNLTFSVKGHEAVEFQALDEKSYKVFRDGLEPPKYLLRKGRLVGMSVLWTPPPDEMIYLIFSNQNGREVNEVMLKIEEITRETIQQDTEVERQFVPGEFVDLAVLLLIGGVFLASYVSYSVLMKRMMERPS